MSTLFDKLREIPSPEREGGASNAMVPASYAEKAMSSLMVLHTDLVAEKDRTLDLTRRLMDERQARAELESYVRLLETELARQGGPDLRETRTDRGDGLERARDRVVASLAGTPTAPSAPSFERDTSDPEGEMPPKPTAPPPRPPRPSSSYRTKRVEPEPLEAAPAPAEAPRAAPATPEPASAEPAMGPRLPEDWRQW